MSRVILKGTLEEFVELSHFIIDQDNLFCVRSSCKGCEHRAYCEKIDDGSILESYYNKATRDNIRFGGAKCKDWICINPSEKLLPYLEEEDKGYFVSDPNKLPTKLQKEIFLSLNNTLLYKVVEDERVLEEDYVLYLEEEDKYICLYKCSLCKHKSYCNSYIVEEDSFKSYVAIDSASQEPTVTTLLTGEPKYVEIFKNNSLKDIPYVWEALSFVVEKGYGGDIDSEKWAILIDKLFFEDKEYLYKFVAIFYELVKDFDNLKYEEWIKEFHSKVKGSSV